MLPNPKTILVDDHQIFRQGLKIILTTENIATITGEASDGIELIDLLLKQKPDLVLMDIDMPRMNGIKATEIALKMMPDLSIIAYTMFADEEYYQKMIRLGVKGFILKSSGIDELEKAILTVMMGKTYFSGKVLSKASNELDCKEQNQIA